ncbi:MAG: ferrous iron transport protein B [Butyricicoccaceae bacterium]
MIFALAGNQNSGKTTLFNQLTGSNQHVGNFPGVTVERKEGHIRGVENATVVDLPGIYSLSPYTSEEIVTRDFILNDHPDGLINIIDGTNIERNLYLTLQLLGLGIPTVLAVNMMDEVRKNGSTIDLKLLSKELGVPVVPIAANKNEGIDELIRQAVQVAEQQQRPVRQDFCSGAVHRAIHAVTHMIEDHAERIHVPPRFAATKLIEGDEPMLQQLKLSPNEIETIEHFVIEMEGELDTDREAALADMRYAFIEGLCAKAVVHKGESVGTRRSERIDELLTHKYLAIPIFFCIMLLIFWLTFGCIGAWLTDGFALLIDGATAWLDGALTAYGINPVVHSLLIDGVCTGVGSVLSFLPTIVTLFFFLSILEDSGYMSRVAFVMDKLLRSIGLSGRSFVPMLIGFGCTVPAVMATRTLSSERDRHMTILLTPFMSCSAKLPIYSMISMAFFPEHAALVMGCLYIGGMVIGVLAGFLLNKTIFRGNSVPFVMELPNYRLPSAKNVVLLLWDKAKDFLTRAFTVIFVATIIIWFLQTFDTRINVVTDAADSMLAAVGSLLAPLFTPLGFGDWRASTALISGFSAKEAVVSTLAVLLGGTEDSVSSMLGTLMTPAASVSFLAFTLLYTPCVAAIAAVRQEMNSGVKAAAVALSQCAVAWCIAFLVYRIAVIVL